MEMIYIETCCQQKRTCEHRQLATENVFLMLYTSRLSIHPGGRNWNFWLGRFVVTSDNHQSWEPEGKLNWMVPNAQSISIKMNHLNFLFISPNTPIDLYRISSTFFSKNTNNHSICWHFDPPPTPFPSSRMGTMYISLQPLPSSLTLLSFPGENRASGIW